MTEKNSKVQMDIDGSRLSLGHDFKGDSNGQGWLEIDIRALDLNETEALLINLGEVQGLFNFRTEKHG